MRRLSAKRTQQNSPAVVRGADQPTQVLVLRFQGQTSLAGWVTLLMMACLCALVAGVAGTSSALAAGDATSLTCSPEAEASPGFRAWLPDCRAYELVSPAQKNGSKIINFGTNGQAPIQASEDGKAITYQANGPIEDEPGGNTEDNQVLSRHDSSGWSSRDITTTHEASSAFAGLEYDLFSESLSFAAVRPGVGYEGSRRETYVRDNLSGVLEPLVTPGNIAPEDRFEIERESAHAAFVGASPDERSIVFQANDALTAGSTADKSLPSLYEWASGTLRLVSVLPDGVQASVAGKQSLLGGGGVERNVRHAISDKGEIAFWEALGQGLGQGEHHLYLRDLKTSQTIQVDAAQGVAETSEPASTYGLFQTASSNGSFVFFTDGKRLTPDATAGGERNHDLYAYDRETGRLTDLTVDPRNSETGETADVRGTVLGASEDGSYVYFVANGVLAAGATPGDCGGSAPAAACNLYVAHDEAGTWTTTFVTKLSAKDSRDFEEGEVGALGKLTSRVSPDGRYLAFMSQRSLVGYDNTDAVSGAADEEVYLYDAHMNKVNCASCSPSGARPLGLLDTGARGGGQLVDTQGNWQGDTLAGNIPGWASVIYGGEAYYQPRYLSDSGRLFFNSADSLVPQDTNGREDVYQYEPEGVSGCGAGPYATRAYGGQGCVALISSGTNTEESAFVDASTSGNDAFFVTAARLSSEDVDGVYDMYDARVCSAERPCAPTPTPPSAACTTSDTCRPAETGPVFASPPSTALSVGGNLASPSPGAAKNSISPRPLTNAQKLARALKSCRKNTQKNKRAACERTVRKRYGPKKVKSRRASAVRGSKR
jgi:hypothetical protein